MPLEEVSLALEKNRHELVVGGPTASKVIEDEGLDDRIYDCISLNFLDISNTCLSEVKTQLSNLINLTNLVLRGNQLSEIPAEIGQLTKLKLVDLSRNKLTQLPQELSELKQLQTLNVSFNELALVPDISQLENLSIIDLSHNCLDNFPDCLTMKSLAHLTELHLNDNCIGTISPKSSNLSVRIFDLCNNKLSNVPGELGECMKLKELRLKGNKLKDRRLMKLVDQCHYKQVLEYIRSHCPKSNVQDVPASKGKSKGKRKKGIPDSSETANNKCTIKVIHVTDSTPVIKCTEEVKDVRPYIIGCIVRDINLEDQSTFKKFITLQTKLHESVCEKRTTATIATHDLGKINGSLLYDAQDPKKIMIQPLMKNKEVSTATLYQQLRDEAEALRKEKKRNTFSGIHKYLYLLDHKTLYPCLCDQSGNVISFPPITNSDLTKISSSTKGLFIEVSSSVSLNICKQVMDSLLREMIESDVAVNVNDEGLKTVVVEQVRVEDKESNLKVVYPSRTDLNLQNINVIHE